MALPPAPVQAEAGAFIWTDWYSQLTNYLNNGNSIPWSVVNKSGSNLTDLTTRDHNTLTTIQGGNSTERYHLTNAQWTALTAGFTGAGVLVLTQSPNILTPNITGTVSANNAAAGSVGEYMTASAGPTGISSGASTNITSLSLTAGDWDVDGNVFFAGAATTVTSVMQSGITTTSGTIPADPDRQIFFGTGMTNTAYTQRPLTTRINVSATTTVYMVVQATFTTSTMTASARLNARRVR